MTQPALVQFFWEQVSEDLHEGYSEQTVQFVVTQFEPMQGLVEQDSAHFSELAQVGPGQVFPFLLQVTVFSQSG